MKPKLMMRPRYSRPRYRPAPRHPYFMYFLLAGLFIASLVAQLLVKVFQQ
ncbi:hypothetical protein MKQ68_21655 [Chitinophaga horti]|uniref:Uncharacterized protein n=1 Tax=Chitinophaga horti TaxID=2920382 RepID=A0ABY6IZ52_9BACT|nr:hypothetical protein [Chitinophaga horti]UYQ92688.1 hypothetical protein MKQ68_21655 [Chitinophaga horti]